MRQSCLQCVAQRSVSLAYLFALDGHVSTRGQQQTCDLEMTMLASNVQKCTILQQTVKCLQQHNRLEGRTSGILLCLLIYSDEAVTQNLSSHANTAGCSKWVTTCSDTSFMRVLCPLLSSSAINVTSPCCATAKTSCK